MKRSTIIVILLSSILSECTLNDPEYKLDFDRVDTTPNGIQVQPINLFEVEITWTVVNIEEVDGYSIYRGVQGNKSPEPTGDSFEKITSVTVLSGEVQYTVIDSSAELNKWNYYYVVANHMWSSVASIVFAKTHENTLSLRIHIKDFFKLALYNLPKYR